MDSVQIVILAAGHGKRMRSDRPKVLLPLRGIPLVKRLLNSIEKSGVEKTPIIVVGQGAEEVKNSLGDEYNYVLQGEQLGTGHAVLSAKDFIKGGAKHTMVLYGDHPLVSPFTIKSLAEAHGKSGAVLTMAIVIVPDFSGFRSAFYDYGRIIRNDKGEIVKIVELKDATPEVKKIKEVNPSYFCFETSWLLKNLSKLKNENKQGEYYLTDLVGLATAENSKISMVAVEPYDALGANTPEQLASLEEIFDSISGSNVAEAEKILPN